MHLATDFKDKSGKEEEICVPKWQYIFSFNAGSYKSIGIKHVTPYRQELFRLSSIKYCVTSRKVAGFIRGSGHLGFLIELTLLAPLWPWGRLRLYQK
jgi:hypothetical protein